MRCLPGQSPPDEQESISPSGAYHSDARPPGSTWLSSELSEVSPDTLTGGGIPRICHRFNLEGDTTTQDKVEPDKDRSFSGSDMRDNLSKILSPTHRQIVGSHSGSLSSPLHYRSLQALKHKVLANCGYNRQIALSEEAKEDLRWWTNNLEQWNSRTMSRLLCTIKTVVSTVGWGAFCQGGNWRLLEHKGTDPSHQRARASSSIVCPEVISEEASSQVHLDQVGQHDSRSPPKQTGWDKIPTTGSPDQGHLFMVHGERHQTDG